MRKPTIFGKYLLLERVNVGGMAEVFIAKAFGVEGFERILAIKKILPTMAEDEEFITMFIDEARISVQLNHANVVHIHELGKHDEAFFIAMEYVSGRDLRTMLERHRRRKEIMPTAQAVYVGSKICEGLDYAHRKKDARGQELHIIHRDVSPQNILCSYEGEVKIIDFGIAKAANRSQKTQAGILKGKFGYMSPEQVRGLPIDRRSDIFAVGVILYEMLTGEKLFVGESDFSTLEKVRNAEVPTPRQFNPNIPAGLEKVLMKSLAREAEDRYQWASDLQEDLMRFLLAGDAIYSAKHLASFMKEAFAEDLFREDEKMHRFASIGRPDEIEQSGVLAQPPPNKRRNTAQPIPATGSHPVPSAPLASPRPRLSSQSLPQLGISTVVGNAAAAVSAAIGNDTVNIPPPSAEELAEMDGAGDRTQIVDGDLMRENLKTSVGISPFMQADATANAVPSAEMQEDIPTGSFSEGGFDATMPPKRKNGAGTASAGSETKGSGFSTGSSEGDDMQPIDQTGFRPAMEQEEGSDTSANQKFVETIERSNANKSGAKQKIVIGDAPEYSGQTMVGPSPLAPKPGDDSTGERPQVPTTRLFKEHGEEGDEEEASEDNDALGDVSSSDDTDGQGRASVDEEPQEEEEQASVDPTNATIPPKPRPVRRSQPRKNDSVVASMPPSRKRLVIFGGIGGAIIILMGLISVLMLANNPARLAIQTTPEGPFTVKVSKTAEGGENTYDGAQAIELDPGDYFVDVIPASKAYQRKRLKVHLSGNQMLALPVVLNPTGPPARGEEKKPARTEAKPPPSETKPTEARPAEVKPELKAYTVNISSDEPNVEFTVDGKKAGKSPRAKVEGLTLDKPHVLVAKKDGFKVYTFNIENVDKLAEIDKYVVLEKDVTDAKPEPAPKEEKPKPEPVAKKEPKPKAEPVAKKEPEPKAEPKPKPEPVAKKEPEPKAEPKPKAEPPPPKEEKPVAGKGKGKLACASKPAGAEVWIDGKNTGRKTPVAISSALELPAGKHKVIFKLNGKASPPQEITIEADQTSVLKGIEIPGA